MTDMDLDLAEYDQVDEARFFMSHRLGLAEETPANARDLIVTLSSSTERASGASDDTNCENDFVFLPAATTGQQADSASEPATKSRNATARNHPDGAEGSDATKANPKCTAGTKQSVSLPVAHLDRDASANKPLGSYPQATARTSRPLATINSNAGITGKNPFFNLHQITPESASTQAYQPFWMRPESFASKPIGLLEIDSNNSPTNPNHLSDLMHQIITKSDSIYIAIPCAYCHEPKACPPSDISGWLNHMNRAHNCKVCPICSKLVGLGPMRDIEIMKKHVLSHIDDDWLERRSAKTNFSFGLQQQWFAGARCNVKDPRTLNNYKF